MAKTNFNLSLNDDEWVLLVDTLSDIIKTGRPADGLLSYLEKENNRYTSLYNRIANLSRIQG
jgi:hypothetical protein